MLQKNSHQACLHLEEKEIQETTLRQQGAAGAQCQPITCQQVLLQATRSELANTQPQVPLVVGGEGQEVTT